MRTLALTLFGCLLCGACMAADGLFGSLKEAKSKHPNFFRAGDVTEIDIKGEPFYVYCGETERCFQEERKHELLEEAELDAKARFYLYVSNEDPTVDIKTHGTISLYRYNEGDVYCVVLATPRKGVSVVKKDKKTAQKDASPKEDVPGASIPQTVASGKQSVTNIVSVHTEMDNGCHVAATSNILSRSILKNKSTVIIDVDMTNVVANSENTNRKVDPFARKAARIARLVDKSRKDPQNYLYHLQLARLLCSDAKVIDSCEEYMLAVKLSAKDPLLTDNERVVVMCEAARFMDNHHCGASALKIYRLIQRIGNAEKIEHATMRIADLLLHYQ